MTILADANNRSTAGRWVLMPQRGQRFMGHRDRSRARVRRRRRQVFTVLVEATGITFLIGLVPRLRPMLYGTVLLVVILVAYTVLLLKIHADELAQARMRRAASAYANGDGIGNGHAGLGHGFAVDGAYSSAWGDVPGPGGFQVIDEDVHVVVRTSEEMEREAILAEASNSR